MPSGTIKWFNKEKGFGFITPDDGSRDIYLQSSNLATEDHTIMDGQRVEFEISMGRKGPEAINIKEI